MLFINKFIEILRDYTNEFSTYGIIHLAVDVVLTFIIIFLLYCFLRIKIHKKRALLLTLLFFIVYGIIYAFQLMITFKIMNWLLFWSMGIIVIVFSQDIKHFIETTFHSTR
ncbi:MAG: hypothetical protein WCQ80_03985, partial [Bacilli bacterium]